MKKTNKRDTSFVVHSIKQHCTKINRECTSRLIFCRTLDGANKLAKALVSGDFDIDYVKMSQCHYTYYVDPDTTKADTDLPYLEVHFYAGVDGLHGKKMKAIQAFLLKHKSQIDRITLGRYENAK